MKNVIVTGANGFIGSSLIKKIIQNNIFVVAIDISFKNSKLPKSDLINAIEISLDNAEDIEKLISSKKYDCFYHFAWAGVNGGDKANPYVQLKNIEMTLNCATIAKK